ncbi:MAG: hypothetical protein BAJATHORv1_40159 [Candidatus Thorarchaeota archaeon]|nr:MAG: hypothetical protein BAJATHORv1_40159 [Candidatus Thorarchaeota archaeon]
MSGKVTGTRIKISSDGINKQWAKIQYTEDGMVLITKDAEYTFKDNQILLHFEYEILTNVSGISERRQLDKEIVIGICPFYKSIETYQLGPVMNPPDFYPPASGSWVNRLRAEGREMIVLINQIHLSERYWISIFDPKTGYVFESREIKEYEKNYVIMKTDWDIYQEWQEVFYRPYDAEEIVNQPAPNWAELALLGGRMNVTSTKKAQTMREAIDQYIPSSYPLDIKQQIRIFFAWITKGKIPDEDPVDFLGKMGDSMVLRLLMFGHLQCLLDDSRTPRYAEIMDKASKGQIKYPKRSLQDSRLREPWYLAVEVLMEQFPNWTKEVIDISIDLMNKEDVFLHAPVSSDEAKKSQEMWKKRLAIMEYGISLTPFYQTRAYGLPRVVYIGAAHRWPHKHLEMIIQFGEMFGKPQYIQLMTMPFRAIERLRRTNQKVTEITWSKYRVNLDLYDSDSEKWTADTKQIVKSLNKTFSIRRLNNEFDGWRGKKTTVITKKDAKALDFASQRVYLSATENQEYWNFFSVDRDSVSEAIEKLDRIKAIDYFYHPLFYRVPSVISIAQGSPGNVLSYARALLKYTPSTTVHISKDSTQLYALSRLPHDQVLYLIQTLPEVAIEQGVNLRVERMRGYKSYRNDLHQRLLLSDDTWDEDLSGLLSQIR